MTTPTNYSAAVKYAKPWHDEAVTLKNEGHSWREIARRLRMPKTTVRDFLAKVVQHQSTTPAPTTPKILIFDIETTPHLGYVWRCFKTFLGPTQLKQYSQVMCFAAKWLGDSNIVIETFEENLPAYQKGAEDADRTVIEVLWSMFNEADIVVAHNGVRFDVKMMNARWAALGLQPPSPYKVVDTFRIAKAMFNFPHLSLDGLCRHLDLGHKLDHEGFELWTSCMAGDPEAWERMKDYNAQDVVLLERLYVYLRSWDKQGPNLALYYDDDKPRCVACGSENLQITPYTAKTAVSEFATYRCGNCGKVCRSSKRIPVDKEVLRHVQ